MRQVCTSKRHLPVHRAACNACSEHTPHLPGGNTTLLAVASGSSDLNTCLLHCLERGWTIHRTGRHENAKNRYFKLLTRRSSVKWTGTWDVKTPRGEYKHIGSNVLWSEKQTRKFRSTYWPHLWGKTVRTLQLEIIRVLCVTPGFRRGVNEVCALLGRYAA